MALALQELIHVNVLQDAMQVPMIYVFQDWRGHIREAYSIGEVHAGDESPHLL
ncbi:hypothetical protein BGW80DRAFT_1310900 [Lactifluus volemus]|nr:hypothetical protein BGW80DRAFT_1310900 [Lactifluus volemus]